MTDPAKRSYADDRAHELTLRQFARAMREDFFADNPGTELSRAAYDREYPARARCAEWLSAIAACARRGAVVRRQVLDDLEQQAPGWVQQMLLHDYPRAIPDGYLLPSVRAANRASETAFREARRRGRQHADELQSTRIFVQHAGGLGPITP